MHQENSKFIYDDKLIQHYFDTNKDEENQVSDSILPLQGYLFTNSAHEVKIHIEEELYYNNGVCLIDGFVFVSKGYKNDMVISVEENDCYNVRGYLCPVAQKNIRNVETDQNNMVEKLTSNSIDTNDNKFDSLEDKLGGCKIAQFDNSTDIINANNNEFDSLEDKLGGCKIAQFENKNIKKKCDNSLTKYQKIKQNTSLPKLHDLNKNCNSRIEKYDNKSEDKIKKCNLDIHKLDLTKSKNINTNIKKYTTKENLFLIYSRKDINLINITYKNGKYILQVNDNIENFKLKIILCKSVYDVELHHSFGVTKYDHNIVTWTIKTMPIGLYELDILRFGNVKKEEQIQIRYDCFNYKNSGIKIVEVQEQKRVYVKSTFKVIKYNQNIKIY